MTDTSTGLLTAARCPNDADAWGRLVALYTPLLHGWLRRQGVQHADCEDLVQDALATAAGQLPTFSHNGRPGAFRCWLRTIVAHRLRAFRRRQLVRATTSTDSDLVDRLAEELTDPASDLARRFDGDHDRFVLRRTLDAIQPEFEPRTWTAFQRTALDGADPVTVAAQLGVPVTVVYNAKFRILKRLREASADFLR
jgi:RNA polymerase sigma-70 factor (ECF subfamily)